MIIEEVVILAYGDVGGPNLDFSNMGCIGFCPELLDLQDWLLLFAIIITMLYVASWMITIARRFFIYVIKTYRSKNEGVVGLDLDYVRRVEEERKSFNLKKELVVLWYCSIVAFLIIAFLTIAFS
tara:strand:+ start:471 stop:845 length:375 start_codon:yes stop_codon:yes gene_type:complete